MPFLAPDIGIDLGTENINVYVRGRGIVISEPSLVVLDRDNRHMVRAVGDEARFLFGRTPDQLIAVTPIKNGQVADFDLTELMAVCSIVIISSVNLARADELDRGLSLRLFQLSHLHRGCVGS